MAHGDTSYKGPGRLAGRKALSTGGDSGMGRASASPTREGADVAINYHPDEEPDAKEVIALIREAGRKAIALPGDLRDEKFCGKLVADAVAQLGGLDILVSNAGRQQAIASILELSTEEFDDDEDQHLRAVLAHQSRAAAPEARLKHRRHHIGAAGGSLARPLSVRDDQGRDDQLRAFARQAIRG